MTPNEFVNKYKPFALQTEAKTGISHVFILAQAALESGWGERAPGNMFFGVKDTDGINGNEQLITTTEYMRTPNAKFPVVLKVVKWANGIWKYTVKDWFRKFNTPEESFTKHAEFFLNNKRYAKALQYKSDPKAFAREISNAGYATDPSYYSTLCNVIDSVKRRL